MGIETSRIMYKLPENSMDGFCKDYTKVAGLLTVSGGKLVA